MIEGGNPEKFRRDMARHAWRYAVAAFKRGDFDEARRNVGVAMGFDPNPFAEQCLTICEALTAGKPLHRSGWRHYCEKDTGPSVDPLMPLRMMRDMLLADPEWYQDVAGEWMLYMNRAGRRRSHER